MQKQVLQLVIFLALVSVTQVSNAEQTDNIKISKNECISRVSGDIHNIKKLPEKPSSLGVLKKLSSTYSYCAFYFKNKDIFYSYMSVADNIGIMAAQLELHYEGVTPLKYREDKNNVIKSLEKLITLKS